MYEQYYKEFIKQFHYLSEKYNKYTVFLDFLKLTSISLHNMVCYNQELENIYIQIIIKYKKDEQEIFPHMLSMLMYIVSNKEISDILGDIYMKEKIRDVNLGQVFTPFHISELVGKAICGTKEDMQNIIKENGFISVNEPCSGSGSIVLGFVKALDEQQIDFQQDLLVYASDIDEMCMYMTYVQLSLYGIPAIVCHEDSLSMKKYFELETPSYLINYKKFEKFTNNKVNENVNSENIIKFNEVIKNGVCQMSFF